MKATHSQQLERWLGTDKVNHLSESMKGWYGKPIPVHGVPGNVFATKDGDFIGEIRAGYEATVMDRCESIFRRLKKNWKKVNYGQLNAGFTGLADLVAKSQAKSVIFNFQKVGVTGVAGSTNSLWRSSGSPGVGDLGAAAPGGSVCNSLTNGSPNFNNTADISDTMHFISALYSTTISSNSLLMYDRLFSVAKTMNVTTAESVTGVPTRYQSTTPGDPDSIEGNFAFIETHTSITTISHNWTVCTYVNQAGNAATFPLFAGQSGCINGRLNLPAGSWFWPLATGDTGVKNITQMQVSAPIGVGLIAFTIGFPHAWMPCPVATMVCSVDGLASSFNLSRIHDDSCLSFLEINKPSTSAASYSGIITLVSG